MKKPTILRACVWLAAPLFLLAAWTVDCSKGRVLKREGGLRIGVSYPKELGSGPFDGRMLLILADNDGPPAPLLVRRERAFSPGFDADHQPAFRPEMAAHMIKTAPPDADVASWQY